MNEEWKKVYREGFADGYAAAKKEMNYLNFPPVYYGGVGSAGTKVNDPRAAVMGTPPYPGYAVNNTPEHFVTGMSVTDIGC